MNLNSIKQRITSKKPKVVGSKDLSNHELSLLVVLTAYKKDSDGWMTRKEILDQKDSDGICLYKENSSNLQKYLEGLIKKGLVEKSIDKSPDIRGRIPLRGINIWRLKRDDSTRYYVYCLIQSSVGWSIDKGWQSKINILNKNIKSPSTKEYYDRIFLGSTNWHVISDILKRDYFYNIPIIYKRKLLEIYTDKLMRSRIEANHYERIIEQLKNKLEVT